MKQKLLSIALGALSLVLLVVFCLSTNNRAIETATQTVAAYCTTSPSVPPMTTEPVTAFNTYDVPLDINIQWYVETQSKEYGIAPELVFAIIFKESTYNIKSVGALGELGLMQIHPCNFDEVLEEVNAAKLMDPFQNIKAGIYLLDKSIRQTDTLTDALMVYNLGQGRAKEAWAEGVDSTAYTREVLAKMAELEGQR